MVRPSATDSKRDPLHDISVHSRPAFKHTSESQDRHAYSLSQPAKPVKFKGNPVRSLLEPSKPSIANPVAVQSHLRPVEILAVAQERPKSKAGKRKRVKKVKVIKKKHREPCNDCRTLAELPKCDPPAKKPAARRNNKQSQTQPTPKPEPEVRPATHSASGGGGGGGFGMKTALYNIFVKPFQALTKAEETAPPRAIEYRRKAENAKPERLRFDSTPVQESTDGVKYLPTVHLIQYKEPRTAVEVLRSACSSLKRIALRNLSRTLIGYEAGAEAVGPLPRATTKYKIIRRDLYKVDESMAFLIHRRRVPHQVPAEPFEQVCEFLKTLRGDKRVIAFGNDTGIFSETLVHPVTTITNHGDFTNTGLKPAVGDAVVFCLTLRGLNLKSEILEVNRILKMNGLLIIAERASKYTDQREFADGVQKCGFELLSMDNVFDLYYYFVFKKVKNQYLTSDVEDFSLLSTGTRDWIWNAAHEYVNFF